MCVYKVCSPPPTSHGLMKPEMLVPTYMYVYILRVFMCFFPAHKSRTDEARDAVWRFLSLTNLLLLSLPDKLALSFAYALFLSFARPWAYTHLQFYSRIHTQLTYTRIHMNLAAHTKTILQVI